jgi:outer membrane protein assembly factor BamB
VVGGKVLATAESDLLICLDAGTGRELWRKTHKISELPPELNAKELKLPAQGGSATPTPVSDGRWVYVFLGSGVVASYDLEGNRRWIQWHDLPQTNAYGRTASPLLVGERLLVHFGPLACLDARTGELMWQNKRAPAAYGTSATTRIGGVEVVVTPMGDIVRVADGKVLASNLATMFYSSPVIEDGVAYFIDATAIAVQLPEKADEPFTPKELWSVDLEGEFFASPVVHEGLIHTVNKDATYYVLDAKTGKAVVQQTLKLLPGGQASPDVMVYPSPALAGGHLLIANNAGGANVLQPGREFKELQLNSIGQGTGGSYAFAGKCMFIRGGERLYCVGSR